MNPIKKAKEDVIKASKRIRRNLESYGENNNLEIPNVEKLAENIIKLAKKDQKKRIHGVNRIFLRIFRDLEKLDDCLFYINDPDGYCEYLKYHNRCIARDEEDECGCLDKQNCGIRKEKKQNYDDEVEDNIHEGLTELNPFKKP